MSIWASITSIDLGELVDVGFRLQEAGVDGIHVDVSDGVFVPEITFGHRVVQALTARLALPVEAHLMVVEPERHVASLAGAGAARIAFHLEATRYPWRVAGMVADQGVQAGVAINPATPLPTLSYLSEGISFVNVLTTEPDLLGERLLPRMDQRVRHAVNLAGSTPIQVDGGMTPNAVAPLAAAGASQFVLGRALIGSDDIAAQVRTLREILNRPTEDR